jgi:hypothetical protein
LPPEFRLWFSMLGGAFAIPIGLFWMAWTSYPSISIWSPLAASVLFGYGILCVFISCYQVCRDFVLNLTTTDYLSSISLTHMKCIQHPLLHRQRSYGTVLQVAWLLWAFHSTRI